MTQLQKQATEVRSLLNSDAIKTQIAKALPKICTPDKFMRVAMTAVTKNPKIAESTQETLMSCLLDCAQLGIEPDGRRAHLIPFNNRKKGIVECQLIIDYKGLVELVRRSGEVATLHADKVCEHDNFVYNAGKVEKHVIDFKKPRGKVYAFYAYAEMKDGSQQSEVMTVEEVEKIRQASNGKNSSPWSQHFDEMGKKTVFRRLSKWLPMATEVMAKIDEIEAKEFDFDMTPEAPNFKSAEDLGLNEIEEVEK